jgi:hypothetical protein
MKAKFLILYLVVIIFLVSWLAISDVEALNVNWPLTGSKTLCWNTVDWTNRPDHIIKLRVTSMGGNYYILMSTMQKALGMNLEAIMGYARVVGKQIRSQSMSPIATASQFRQLVLISMDANFSLIQKH